MMLLAALGLMKRLAHTLRKTFGFHAYKGSTDIVLLQQIFNHSSPSVTLRYIGIIQDDIDNVLINLNL
jgi:integrase